MIDGGTSVGDELGPSDELCSDCIGVTLENRSSMDGFVIELGDLSGKFSLGSPELDACGSTCDPRSCSEYVNEDICG